MPWLISSAPKPDGLRLKSQSLRSQRGIVVFSQRLRRECAGPISAARRQVASSSNVAVPPYCLIERKKDAPLFLGAVQRWPEKEEPMDAALMERILQREPRALEILYDRYSRPVYSLVLRISQQSAAAEEIVQDVFLQIWRNADRYQVSRGPLAPGFYSGAEPRASTFFV